MPKNKEPLTYVQHTELEERRKIERIGLILRALSAGLIAGAIAYVALGFIFNQGDKISAEKPRPELRNETVSPVRPSDRNG